MTSISFRPSLPRSAVITLAALTTSVVLSGCAGPQVLRSSYVQYAESFALASNQQLLLNLARLRNGHPPHFLQMGAVTAQFSFTAGLTGDYRDADGAITKGMGLSLGTKESPTFNFTPLSGAAYSQILLTPIKGNVLYSLINQNLPVSILLRLMVDRITLTYANGVQATFVNRFNKANPENYGDFLRLTAHLERLRARDMLEFKTDEKTDKVRFSLNPETQRAMGQQAAADPQYKLVTFNPRTGEGVAEVDINTRSFLTVMFSSAKEASLYNQFSAEFLNSLPNRVQEPVIRIDVDPAYTEPVSAEVEYAGKNYVISDKPGSSRNRITFTLLQFLASQTQLDPSKLPVQQLIQVQ